jgi:hypothetical protein
MSCRFTTGAFGLPEGDRRHVTPPPIGLVRTHESTRTLTRYVERGTGPIRSATLTHQGGRWFCSFSVEVERHGPAPARPESVIGCRPRRHVPGGAVHRRGHRQPPPPRSSAARAAQVATAGRAPYRP